LTSTSSERWSFNLGLIVCPSNTQHRAVYKTPSAVSLERGAALLRDPASISEVTTMPGPPTPCVWIFRIPSASASRGDRRDTLTLVSDYTRSNWSSGRIYDWFAGGGDAAIQRRRALRAASPPVFFESSSTRR